MEFLIYVTVGFIFASSLLGAWYIIRLVNKLDGQNKISLEQIMHSSTKSKEVLLKLDDVLRDGQKSRNHQQKLFDHDRVLLASLNSQVAKLDILMRVASNQDKNLTNVPPNGPGKIAPKSNDSRSSEPSEVVSSIFKLDSKSLPKTDNGIALLEQLFNQRKALGKPDIIQKIDTSTAEDVLSEKLEEPAIRNHAPEVKQADESLHRPQVPHQQSSPRTILNLFSNEAEQSSTFTPRERHRA